MKRKRIILLLALVGMFLATDVAFAGDPKPDFYELRVKPVSQLPVFWTNEDGTYTSPAEGHLHTILYAGNSTSSALSTRDNIVTVESGWDWGADVNGVWLMVQASTVEGGKRGRCYAHYIAWNSGQLAQVLAMIEQTLQFYFERNDYEKTDRVSQGLLRIPELGGGDRSKYSLMRLENFVKWIDRKGKCKDKVGLLERSLRAYPGDSVFTQYLEVAKSIQGDDCGGITSANLGVFPRIALPAPSTLTPVPPAPTATPIPFIPVPPTPIPPSSTPVPPTPLVKTKVIVVRVTLAPTNSPRPAATAVPVVQSVNQSNKDLRDSFDKVCTSFVVILVLILLGIGVGRLILIWYQRQEEQRKKEAARKSKTEEEWQEEFLRCLLEAQGALRKSPPDTDMATRAFLEADKLLGFANHDERKELKKIRRRLFELGVKKI